MSTLKVCQVLIMGSDGELKKKLEETSPRGGLEIMEADSINQFYTLILQRKPELAFLDINSSDYDGLKLAIGLSTLRARVSEKRLLIVAISNFCTPTIRMAYGKYGLDFVLERPLDKSKLLGLLSWIHA